MTAVCLRLDSRNQYFLTLINLKFRLQQSGMIGFGSWSGLYNIYKGNVDSLRKSCFSSFFTFFHFVT